MTENRLRRIAPAGYALGLLLLIIPLLELVMGTWPPRPSMVNWRFGVVGLLANGLLLPTLGGAILIAVAAGLGHRRTLRVLAVVAVLGALAELTALLLFSLDVVQMRSMVTAEVQLGFDLASLKAMISLLFGASVLAALGVTGWRASRPHRRPSGRAAQKQSETLVLKPAAAGVAAPQETRSKAREARAQDAPETV